MNVLAMRFKFAAARSVAVGVIALGLLGNAPTIVSAYDLIWNTGDNNFTGGQFWSYDNEGVLATTDNPFTHVGNKDNSGFGGESIAYIGNGATVTLNTTTFVSGFDNLIYGVRVGTANPVADLTGIGGANLQGDGTLTVTGDNPLLVFDPLSDGTFGEFIVGGGVGTTGTVNWNSTGELDAQFRIRIGQSGTGVFNQNDGKVVNGRGNGGVGFMAVGGQAGTGTYNLNNGTLQLGDEFAGQATTPEKRRRLIVGIDGDSTGTLNVGDGVGAAGSALIETWDEVDLGEFGATGNTLRIQSDGMLRARFSKKLVDNGGDPVAAQAEVRVGLSTTGSGTIIQDGGTLHTDSRLQVGVGSGTGTYDINGPGSTIMAQALSVGQNGTLDFGFTSAGTSPITLEGSLNTAGDDESGVELFTGASLLLSDFTDYTSGGDITLVNSLDPAASLTGQFSGLNQGASVGFANGGGTEYFINYFGGTDNNDIVLQTSITNSLTDGLVWNAGTATFGAGGGWAKSDGMFGVASAGVDPFGTTEDLFLGNDGTANLSTTGTVKSLEIGTSQASSRIAGTNGDGTLTTFGSASLTVSENLTVGAGGQTGTVNWNSTGTLGTNDKFRVGEGGTGVFNQTAGTVTGGDTAGAVQFLAIGSASGGTGTYNLDGGSLKPAGGLGSTERRNLRVGDEGGIGELNVGDGAGAAGSALVEFNDDLFIGRNGGTGTVNIAADGRINLVTEGGNRADLFVGLDGGNGTVTQTGGSVSTDAIVGIGNGNGAVGVYTMTGGTWTAGVAANPQFRVGSTGGNGTFSVGGDASFSHEGDFFIAHQGGTASVGLLELLGSDASFSLAKLENAPGTGGAGNGNDETMRWEADASGITTITISGTSGVDNFVQIQDPDELAANTGSSGSLMGDGIALELDLSALSGDMMLTLIENNSAEGIIGFFEDGNTMDLYEEGESIFGTGFAGTVNISYVGGTGNDVVLSLVAGVGGLVGDYNNDGMVDAVDYALWRENLGGPGSALANRDPANSGVVGTADFLSWQDNFGASNPGASGVAAPEPAALVLLLGMAAAMLMVFSRRRPSRQEVLVLVSPRGETR